MMSTSTEIAQLRAVATHFQRSINVTYDIGNAEYIGGYIPTPNGATALSTILENTSHDKRQRAHVIHAAYGSGKSLLSLVLSELLNPHPETKEALNLVLGRLHRNFPNEASIVSQFLNRNQRLLPVILSGDEGPLHLALPRALSKTLSRLGLGDLRPKTQFKAALDAISLWEQVYPAVFLQLDQQLKEQHLNLADFRHQLEIMDVTTLDVFEHLYPQLTAGATFDRYGGQKLVEAFYTTAEALHDVDYDGIVVIWDEFGRFIESRVGQAFGTEAALLQEFAEFCNRSGQHQVHLVLSTHQLLSGYATNLPISYQQEWARIAERFAAHNVAGDPAITYRLIAEALFAPDQDAWRQFISHHNDQFSSLTTGAIEFSLFEDVDDKSVREAIIEHTWPIHPLTLYALPRLAGKVAQNERTLFTFLGTDEPATLLEFLNRYQGDWETIGLDQLWDYFAKAIRADLGAGGTHSIWSGVMYALGKIDKSDEYGIAQAIVKALGVLLIIGETDIQYQSMAGHVRPTIDLIAWGLNLEPGEVQTWLNILSRRRAVVYRQADGYWMFTRGSDIDLEAEISQIAEKRTLSSIQIRQILDQELPLPYHLPRSYNQSQRMTRYFHGFYFWPDDIPKLNETFLKELKPIKYADGAVIYVLVTDQSQRNKAIEAIQLLPPSRFVFVIPEKPLIIDAPLNELSALRELGNNVTFMAQDERLPQEIKFFVDDCKKRLDKALQPLIKVNLSEATWWWHNRKQWQQEKITNERDSSRLFSQLCHCWFSNTPIINNESINRHEPSGQQIRAAEKVIDALFSHPEDAIPDRLGLVGFGPDYLVYRTLLVNQGLLSPSGNLDNEALWQLTPPTINSPLALIFDLVNQYLQKALENPQEFTLLIDQLLSPPYGLRRGVLPVLLATIFKTRLHVLTIRQNKRPVSLITGELLTNMSYKPEQFTVEIGPWDAERAALWEALQRHFSDFIGQKEQIQQPLSYLSVGLLRWLQAQPRFCRDTNQISDSTKQFRNLIRKAQRDPARVLLYDLLDLLWSDRKTGNPEDLQDIFFAQLQQMMGEIATAYQSLLYQLDQFVEKHFSDGVAVQQRDGYNILNAWLRHLAQIMEQPIDELRFSDPVVQSFVLTIQNDQSDGRFWDDLSYATLGVKISDWNDRSVDTFKNMLLNVKSELEKEVLGFADDAPDAIQLSVDTPNTGKKTYRFRTSSLSPQGQRILQNFKSTLEIAGRPLSETEKKQVVFSLLNYILDNEQFNAESTSTKGEK